jgi:V/A-type H+-transporting ATPase subunit F
MNFFVLADEDIVLGFRYVGIPGEVVDDPDEAEQAFDNAVNYPDAGILIITEKIAQAIKDKITKWEMESSYPLIVEIPDFDGHIPDRRSLAQAIREAVGINI